MQLREFVFFSMRFFNPFFLIKATDKSKISADCYRIQLLPLGEHYKDIKSAKNSLKDPKTDTW